MLILTAIVAASCPSFGKILALVGGSTVPLLSFVLPSMFYLKLSQNFEHSNSNIKISKIEKIFHVMVMLLGGFGAVASTYVAVKSVVTFLSFKQPCYLSF